MPKHYREKPSANDDSRVFDAFDDQENADITDAYEENDSFNDDFYDDESSYATPDASESGYRRDPYDNDMGLTQAFSPMNTSEFVSVSNRRPQRDWSEDETGPEPPQASRGASSNGPAGTSMGKHGKPGKYGKHARPKGAGSSTQLPVMEPPSAVSGDSGDQGYASVDDYQAQAEKPVPVYIRRSRRMRIVLIVVIVLLIILLAIGAFLVVRLFETVEDETIQQTQNQQDVDVNAIYDENSASDAATATVKTATVPDLAALLGLNQDQAVEELQRGALVSSSRDVNEEGNPIKKEVRVALTQEPSDSRTGTPTVFLGLNDQGIIIQAGYSTSTTSLGYGSLSFADAVQNEHIIDATLEEAGITIEDGAVTLPEDETEYSTYTEDGNTLAREYCSFTGEAEIDGTPHQWSAVLSYDYSMANVSGNLSDTVRTIYVYVNA